MRINHPKPVNNSEKTVLFLKVTRHYFDRVTEEEKQNVWYTAADYDKAFKNEKILRNCISTKKHPYRKNQENLNAQGIYTESQALKKDADIEASLVSVFREQQKQKAAMLSARQDSKLVLNNGKVAEAYRSHSQDALEQAQKRAKCLQDEEREHVTKPPKSPFSPSRFFLKTRSRSPTRSKNTFAQKLVAAPSVFVPEESASQVTKLTTPAA